MKHFNCQSHLLLFIAVCFFSISCTAQELKRKASLGIQMTPLADSIAVDLHIAKGKGLQILQVFPNTTAAKAGIKPNAVLLEINEQEVNTIPDLFATIQNLRKNDPVTLSYFQDGKQVSKTVKAAGKPKETYKNTSVYYEQVVYEGNKLRSILCTPKGIKNPPVVFYMQGYTCQSIDLYAYSDVTTSRLFNDWLQAGFAVFRVEKPGVGDSQCDKGCMEIDFNEETEAFKQAYKHLQKDNRIDADNIILFGHSMGGMIAPILAKEFKPKGVISYGVVSSSWFEYMQELTRVQGEYFNQSYEEIENDLRRSTPFWYELLVAQKSNTEILQNTVIKNNLKNEGILADFENGLFMDRHYTFWSTLNQLSFTNTWINVESHVLALYGEFDIQALHAGHVKNIAGMVNSKHPGKGNYQIVPKSDHGFVHFESMQDNVNALNTGQYMEKLRTAYSPATAHVTIEWMNAIVK